MQKYPIYAIVAIVFVGIIKLLQVTAFDVDQYSKNKENSFAKTEIKAKPPIKKEKAQSAKPSEKQEASENATPPPKEAENAEAATDPANETEVDNTPDTPPVTDTSFEDTTENTTTTYSGLTDLKNRYLAPLIANLPQGQLREDVVIRYYKHDQDGDRVYSLRDLGYYIHEKEASETAGLGSNVMYYGEDVSTEDIQIVAYTLLANGLPLKAIVPTQFSWKSNSIEIGTDTLLINSVNLSESVIQEFSK